MVPPEGRDSWCHLQETMTMLQLTSAQIRTSIMDGEDSVSQLTHTLESIANRSQLLRELLDSDVEAAKEQTVALMEDVNRGVMACQFHDRVSQRLDHVTNSISQIAEIVTNPSQFSDANKWQSLQNNISESYTMDCERLMFEQIMMGRTVEEALELYRHHFTNINLDDDDDDIEFF
jgi:hypothetical protein